MLEAKAKNGFVQDEVCKMLYQSYKHLNKTYHIQSYGCQMNTHDSEKLAGMLSMSGFSPAASKEEADIILFNTCCVREHAEKRVFGNIGALKKLKDEKPKLIIGVCGCMMQQEEVADRLMRRFPFVDLVFGTHNLNEFPSMLKAVLDGERTSSIIEGCEIEEGLPVKRADGVSAFINIIYGCNNYCSYCIVPYVRGRERSREPEKIVEEAKALADQGYKEITLLGQNVNSYAPNGEKDGFAKLLYMLNDIDGIERIRFMTSHPKDLSRGLIEAMVRLPKVCNHIHLPVQSGSNRILEAMNRRYTREHYMDLVDQLREHVSGIELTTDIIVGFPSETEEDFNDTLDLVNRVGFSSAYTFMYSPRRGTKAAKMPGQLDAETKKMRLLALNELQAEHVRANNKKYIGKSAVVLTEGYDERKGLAFGKMTNFKMVYFPADKDAIGRFISVKIEGEQKNSLIGRIEGTNMSRDAEK
ncbi:MAG: (Dimethylallyl)adenosine tRNA methylthiotransferase MiaB [Firmicutes bacterium ADurb.Bin182]|nr:MAG: (Dimethylallyl)adenosine tRNA methylthiotransferase MiaB [Firmicutes bacterium ADurb.Bin182]